MSHYWRLTMLISGDTLARYIAIEDAKVARIDTSRHSYRPNRRIQMSTKKIKDIVATSITTHFKDTTELRTPSGNTVIDVANLISKNIEIRFQLNSEDSDDELEDIISIIREVSHNKILLG